MSIDNNNGTVTFNANIPNIPNYSLMSSINPVDTTMISIKLQKDSANYNLVNLNFKNSTVVQRTDNTY